MKKNIALKEAYLKVNTHYQVARKQNAYLHDAVISVARILSRMSGRAVYLSLINPSKPDC